MFAVFYGGKKEKFVNMPSLSQNMKQLFAQFQIGPYIEEIDKNHYEATKSFRDRKDYYNVGYILALTHTAEANIINNIIISDYKYFDSYTDIIDNLCLVLFINIILLLIFITIK